MDLPLHINLQNQIWKLVLSRKCFEFFEIEKDRQTPKRMDRIRYFDPDVSAEETKKYMEENYFIYTYAPVDDPIIRGSCKEFKTRKKLDKEVIQSMSLDEALET